MLLGQSRDFLTITTLRVFTQLYWSHISFMTSICVFFNNVIHHMYFITAHLFVFYATVDHVCSLMYRFGCMGRWTGVVLELSLLICMYVLHLHLFYVCVVAWLVLTDDKWQRQEQITLQEFFALDNSGGEHSETPHWPDTHCSLCPVCFLCLAVYPLSLFLTSQHLLPFPLSPSLLLSLCTGQW